MPRLKCTYRQLIEILQQHGFVLVRHEGGSHRIYEATIDAQRRVVVLAYHNVNADIPLGTLKSMIRQAGLPETMFRR